jgi:hypothetical protein
MKHSIDLNRIDKFHNDFASILIDYKDKGLDDNIIKSLTRQCATAGNPETPTRFILQTLMSYRDEVLTLKKINILSRQLAVLSADPSPLGPKLKYEGIAVPEWIPLEVLSTKYTDWRGLANGGINFTFYVLAGTPAGYTVERKLPLTFLARMAYTLGYSKKFNYDYEPSNFIGFRFWVLATPAEGEFKFEEFEPSKQMLTQNKLIIMKRMRFDIDKPDYDDEGNPEPWVCEFERDHDCSECEITSKSCVASYKREHGHTGAEDIKSRASQGS